MTNADLESPISFGRYDLIERLATGGMGEVYLANMRGAAGFQKKVVIKKILPQLSRNPEFVRRFVDEGKLVVKLDHPNIVSVLDLGEVEGDYYLTMEYVDGDDLRAILRRLKSRGERLPVPLAVFVLQEVCKGLSHAHQATDEDGTHLNIIHRDVSPSNIMLSRGGAVRVLDFGIAKASDRLTHSVTGSLKGKFLYMSPEQARGAPLDQRSDVFSVGNVAYELLTGTRPFEGRSDLDTLERVKDATPPPIRDHVTDLPDELERIVDTCLARNPAQRYESMETLLRELQDYLFSLDSPVDNADLADFARDVLGDQRTKSAERSLDDILAEGLDRLEAGEAVHADSALDIHTRAADPPDDGTPTPPVTQGENTATQTSIGNNNRILVIGLLVIIGILLYFNIESMMSRPDDSRTLETQGTTLGARDADAQPTPKQDAGTIASTQTDASVGVEDTTDGPSEGRTVALLELPKDAQVSLDGAPVNLEEGGSVQLPVDRSVSLKVTAEGHATFLYDVPPDHDSGDPITVKMQRLSRKIQVRSSPPGALLEIDGRPAGKAPIHLTVEFGRGRRVKATLPGHDDKRSIVRYNGPNPVTVALAPRRTGRVSFRFFPASATVLLDGKPCTSGGSNLVDREIGAGKHTLVIRDPSGKPERRQTFEVVPGETKRLGTISLSSPR